MKLTVETVEVRISLSQREVRQIESDLGMDSLIDKFWELDDIARAVFNPDQNEINVSVAYSTNLTDVKTRISQVKQMIESYV
jgi:hypothetical protein